MQGQINFNYVVLGKSMYTVAGLLITAQPNLPVATKISIPCPSPAGDHLAPNPYTYSQIIKFESHQKNWGINFGNA